MPIFLLLFRPLLPSIIPPKLMVDGIMGMNKVGSDGIHHLSAIGNMVSVCIGSTGYIMLKGKCVTVYNK